MTLLTPTRTTVLVAPEEAGERLDRLLARHVAALSRSRLKALIEAGSVEVDGRTIRDPSHRVNSGGEIKLDIPPARPALPGPEPITLNVVYEDKDIIVIDKPPNMVVHPAAGHWSGTLVNALIAHCGDSLSGIGGERRPGIVHRLDKDTSGVMIVAKNDRAHRALAAQFADHGRSGGAFERGYLAFVWGAPERPHGTIERAIDRDPRTRDRMAVREGGRAATTQWEVLERYGGMPQESQGSGSSGKGPAKRARKRAGAPVASLLACRLQTGRTHQIRVHLASIGHPLMGDPVYGAGFRTKSALLPPKAKEALAGLGRQALHAHILRVMHPSSGEILEFRSELPRDLARLHDALAGNWAGSGDEQPRDS
ncbi:MAG TPA: RluA family pseudouridine synthase [Xanthobacteraceae bacterium]|nr:RluA family pseudouridine synthase [Xanthobacteraceae bacterium]